MLLMIKLDFITHLDGSLISTLNEETQLEAQQGYGYQIWKGSYKDSFRAKGLHGQFCIIYPSKKCVVTITARQEWRPYEIISTINQHIIDKL